MRMTTKAPWLDRKNLEEWLQTRVKDIEGEDDKSQGENYLSKMKRVKVTCENGQVYHLVVKASMEEGTAAELFGETDIFKKEKHMYTTTLNTLHDILREALPDSFEDFAAKCYYACDKFMVLEDLAAAGFRMQNRREGLELDQCVLVMRTLARYHAASIILHDKDPAAFQEYEVPFFCEPKMQAPFTKFLTGMAHSLADEVETWPEEWHKYAKHLRNTAEDMLDITKQVTTRSDSDFNVLIHGDLWTNNMLFKGKAAGVRFVDWQLVNYSSAAIDLIYFIATSSSLQVKAGHMDYLIEEYHNTLCDTLTALGYKKKLITLEELQHEVEKKINYGLLTIVMPYVVMQLGHDSGFIFDEALATGWNPGSRMYGENFRRAVKILLPFYESKGLFQECI